MIWVRWAPFVIIRENQIKQFYRLVVLARPPPKTVYLEVPLRTARFVFRGSREVHADVPVLLWTTHKGRCAWPLQKHMAI